MEERLAITAPQPCEVCGGRTFWVGVGGTPVCGVCHPPTTPDCVLQWLGEAEYLTNQDHQG